jgi:hypothetical protein
MGQQKSDFNKKKNVVDVGLEGRVLVCAVVEESAENRCGWSYVGQRRLYQVLSCIGMERAVLMKSWRLGRADTAPTRRKPLCGKNIREKGKQTNATTQQNRVSSLLFFQNQKCSANESEIKESSIS